MPERKTIDDSDVVFTDTTESEDKRSDQSTLDAAIEATSQNPSLDDFKVQAVRAAASFDIASPAGHHLYWVAMNGKHIDLADARMQRLDVKDWIIYCKEVIRKDGSVDPAGMVTCLFLADGRTVSWASATTNRQWCGVVQIKGNKTFDPPLPIVLIPNASTDKDKSPWYSVLPWGSPEAERAIAVWKDSR